MASPILTPLALWEKFNIDSKPEAELIEEKRENGLIINKIYIDGPLTKKGRVKIFATVFMREDLSTMPAVVLADGLKRNIEKDTEVVKNLAKNGYMVMHIDVGGKFGDKERFTIYPEDIAYADYQNARGHLMEVKESVKETCWYEWGRVLRYALAYLKNQESIKKIGVIGVKSCSTLIWHLAATDQSLSCAVSVLGAGWSVCKGMPKFSDAIEPQFSDEMLKYVAGVEAQSYAKNVLCPMLTLIATNSDVYDCDRAQDTTARISESIYKALDYSVNYVTGADNDSLKNVELFLQKFLLCDNETYLPSEPQVKCDILDKTLCVTATADAKNLKEISIFVAEEQIVSSLRSWKRLDCPKHVIEGDRAQCACNFVPTENMNVAFFFVKAEYENGFSISSNVIAKKFKANEVLNKRKSGIVYSGREKFAESIFCPFEFANVRETETFSAKKENEVVVKSGPMGIDGVTANSGLFTFRVNSSGINLSDDSILMLDVYSKEEGELSIKLFADYFGERKEFVATAKLCGGRVWQNVKIELSKFKTAEGRNIKFVEKLDALCISAVGKFLINNILWI